jgi:hypothetical protein
MPEVGMKDQDLYCQTTCCLNSGLKVKANQCKYIRTLSLSLVLVYTNKLTITIS